MPIRPGSITTLGQGLLDCVCATLETSTTRGCPCRVFLSPGKPAWDCNSGCSDPECAGQLTVHLDGVSNNPPVGVGSRSTTMAPPGCTHPSYASFIVTLLRCTPVMDEYGTPPSGPDLQDAAEALHTDVEAIQSALACCLPDLVVPGIRTLRAAIEAVKILGPEGGCVGIEQRVSFALPVCDCPAEPA